MFASLISALERILYSCLDCHVNLNHLKSELLVWITIEDVKLCLIVLIICTCNYLKYKYVDLGLWDIFNHFYRRNMIIEYAGHKHWSEEEMFLWNKPGVYWHIELFTLFIGHLYCVLIRSFISSWAFVLWGSFHSMYCESISLATSAKPRIYLVCFST